ncbi:hypothetical protein HYW39_00075, partial [Candidatus Curtissbacteria bacterium]|nr:hypothetical protein [Candidatus Curtissbacteria bacterium]
LSFVFFILIAARARTFLSQKFFKNELYPGLLLGFLVLIFLFANFRVNNFSGNYFSQNMVLDALEQLPPNSIAITVHHVFYFGGLYEQKINGKFSDIKLLYFPNEKNRDNEFYQPDLFSRPPDQQFINRVQKGKNLGKAEKYILGVIARNLDKDIFILQGTFEERFFSYLKPYISSYGLWWKIEPDLIHRNYLEASINNLKRLRNGHLKFTDLEHNNQKLDLLIYVVAYRSTGIALAAQGNYDEAIEFLNKSYNIRPVSDKIPKEIELIKQTQSAETKADELADKKDKMNLMELRQSIRDGYRI